MCGVVDSRYTHAANVRPAVPPISSYGATVEAAVAPVPAGYSSVAESAQLRGGEGEEDATLPSVL